MKEKGIDNGGDAATGDRQVDAARRSFLRRSALAAGVLGGIGAVGIPFGLDRTLREAYPAIEDNKVSLPPNGKSVVIIGGGLAGLQAGVELSSRGFKVTVLEKAGLPGGKLKTWRDMSFGPDDHPIKQQDGYRGYARQHGIHCVWQWYNNLREFMGRYGWPLQDSPANPSIYHFKDRDGTRSHLSNPTWVSPFDWVQLAANTTADMGHVPEADRRKAAELLAKLATFDFADEQQRNYLDAIRFADYAREFGLPASALKIFDSLFEMATYEKIDDGISALTAGFLAQLWFGAPKDFTYSWFVNPSGESFIEPMAEYIRQHGGEIHYNTEVTDVRLGDDRIAAVSTSTLPTMRVRRCRVCGELIYGDDDHHECPYCGAEGEGLIDLAEQEKIAREFTADFFISATDIPGAQNFVRSNLAKLGDHDYFKRILDLHATEVYVCGFWVDGQSFWRDDLVDADGEVAAGYFLTGYDHLGIIFNWTLPYVTGRDGERVGLNPECKDYDVSMLEVHVGHTKDLHGLTTREVADRIYGELKEALPGIPDYRAFYVNKWWTYTTYQVGDEQRRPTVQSPIDNLLYIGDMAAVPHVAVYMEKTNVTAKWATNLLLDKIGQREGRIEILPSGTPRSIPISLLKMVESVYL